MTSNYAYTCGNCGKDIMQGQWHTCQMGNGSASSLQYYQWPYVDQRTVNALERIARALERIANGPSSDACDDYNECACGIGDEHCQYCIRPKSEHVIKDDVVNDR